MENETLHPQDETEIAFSRGKTMIMIAGSLVFVGIGIWLLLRDDARIISSNNFRFFFNNQLFAHGIGLVAIVVFGGLAAMHVRRFFDKRPGLILNSEGFVDNASSASTGFVPW